MASDLCHCLSGQAFIDCCQPFLLGSSTPAYAEQLMRSRYSAFVLENEDYLLASWHPSTRPESICFEPAQVWHKLTVKRVVAGALSDQEGWVEFIAVYKINGRAHRLHENSYFVKENQRWYYLNGQLR